jgi:polysaccharide export outer membrane protein
VYASNSKVYYVITDFAGNGEQVTRLSHTGNETVLDAVALIGGLSAVSGKSVWVARPGANGAPNQVLDVDWTAIKQHGDTKTNYQLMSGDRLHIKCAIPREDSGHAPSPYVIEAPDVLTVEVTVKTPESGKPEQLPKQPISGSFTVRPDGTVGLGLWGSVPVAGLTKNQAADAIRTHIQKHEALSKVEKRPEITATVSVLAYNSKRYYVIMDGDETDKGEQVVSLPLTGTETVLDAVANVDGLLNVADKRKIWIARRAPNDPWQTLSVDWKAITQNGDTKTNYALQPGDRLYVKSAK